MNKKKFVSCSIECAYFYGSLHAWEDLFIIEKSANVCVCVCHSRIIRSCPFRCHVCQERKANRATERERVCWAHKKCLLTSEHAMKCVRVCAHICELIITELRHMLQISRHSRDVASKIVRTHIKLSETDRPQSHIKPPMETNASNGKNSSERKVFDLCCLRFVFFFLLLSLSLSLLQPRFIGFECAHITMGNKP